MTDINELFKLVENLKKQKGNECLICQFPIVDKNDEIMLDCKHYYHKSCIYSDKTSITCPYCSKITLLKQKPKVKKICPVVLKTGKRKGLQCGRINCGYHKLKLE
uniref:RING-type domain-containing protein n=1 Tax=Megaviridae environmental sample TaxID=1737588 RepID=A0A5J6VKX3_9VIRU|nr:MAG: hypothetical protein [Megaviridae environmental sample]